MRDNKYRSSTSLSQHVWALKDQGIDFSIQWSIQRKATACQNTTKRCNLCLAEKVEIISADKVRSLNKKTELISKCRHETSSICQTFSHQCLSPVFLYPLSVSSHLLCVSFYLNPLHSTHSPPYHAILSPCTNLTSSVLAIPKPLHFPTIPER